MAEGSSRRTGLTANAVKNARPKEKPYKLSDRDDLYLLVKPRLKIDGMSARHRKTGGLRRMTKEWTGLSSRKFGFDWLTLNCRTISSPSASGT